MNDQKPWKLYIYIYIYIHTHIDVIPLIKQSQRCEMSTKPVDCNSVTSVYYRVHKMNIIVMYSTYIILEYNTSNKNICKINTSNPVYFFFFNYNKAFLKDD